MPAHADLTGADLHESKGVASASANTVYVANGSGSGSWTKVTSSAIDTTTIFTANKESYFIYIDAVGTAKSRLIPMTKTCTVTKVTGVIDGAVTSADETITVKDEGGNSLGTIAFATASATTKGYQNSLTPVSFNTFTAGDWLEIATAGNSGGTDGIMFRIDVTVTA